MKNITVWVVILSVLFAIGTYIYSSTEEVFLEKEIVEVEVMPEWFDETCESCLEAYKTEKRRLELEDKRQELESQVSDLKTEINTINKELAGLWSEDRLLREVKKTFSDNPVLFTAIARSESGLNIRAYNPEYHYDRHGNKICQGSYGLMQIACIHVDDVNRLYDPKYNLEIAKQVYQKQGIKAWGAYTDGRYLAYMY